MTRFGVVLVLGALAAILAGVWLLAVVRPPPGPRFPGAPPARDGARTPAQATAAEQVPASPAERETLPAGAVGKATPRPALAPLERAAPVTLAGVAVRIDAEGLEHAGDDGAFLAGWRRGAATERRAVEVLAGSWSLDVPPDVQLHVRDLVLGGIPVTLEDNEFAVPADRFLSLRGHGRHPVLLHVLSALDDSELTEVEVWNGPYGFTTDIQHPGAVPGGEPVVRGATSPVSVPPRVDSWRADTQYFVRAPGFAWGTIALNHSAAGERTLVLQPAGALEVELIGNADWLEPEIRLWPPSASRRDAYAYAKLAPDDDDRAVFESLAPGRYFVSVERGWADRRTSYGSVTVDVVAGERLTVSIHVQLPEKPVTVRVAGSLVLPRAWEREGLKLLFRGEGATEKWLPDEREVLLASMRPLPDAPEACEAFAWEVELPSSGSFRLEVFPLLVRRLLEVPEEGLEDVEVVVPPPSDVEVRIVDAKTRAEIPVESLFWSTPAIEGIVATPLYTALADPESGRPRFRAPAGEICLAPVDRSLLAVDEDDSFTVEPGENRLDFEVHRQIGVRFTFKDGDAIIPWDWSWRLSAHRVDRGGSDRARSIGILWFLEEGTYELRSVGIPGFQSIDGIRIDVVAGRGLIDVEIPLIRQ